MLLLTALLWLQAGDPAAQAWDKIRSHLEERIRGEDLDDRVRAMGEAASTKNLRAFDLLVDSMRWAQDLLAQAQKDLDPAKKALSQLRDEYSRQTKERQKLLSKKSLSASDAERLQSLNASIVDLDKSIQSKKAEVEKRSREIASLSQIEASAQNGCAALLRESSPGLFESYRAAFAKALGYPGALSQGPLYVGTLVRSARKEAAPHLEQILRDAKGSESLFLAAAEGFAALQGSSSFPTLISLLAFPNSSVRKAAHEALKKATGQSLPLDKTAWERWLQEGKSPK